MLADRLAGAIHRQAGVRIDGDQQILKTEGFAKVSLGAAGERLILRSKSCGHHDNGCLWSRGGAQP